MKKLPQAVSTGLILGTLCLAGALGFWYFAPEFNGLIERNTDDSALPVWVVLAILALVNFAYAGLSGLGAKVMQRNHPEDGKPEGPEAE